MNLRSLSLSEELLSSGFAESGQRLLPAQLRFLQDRLEAWVAPQRIERPAGRESRGHKVRLGEGSPKIEEPLLVLAHIAQQPSHPENEFRVVMNRQRAHGGESGEHVRWAAMEPAHEAVTPCLKRSDARRLAAIAHEFHWPQCPRTVRVVPKSVFACEAIDVSQASDAQRRKVL